MMGLTFLIGFFVAAVIKLIAYAADSFDFYSSHRLELLRLRRWRQHRQKVERLVRQIPIADEDALGDFREDYSKGIDRNFTLPASVGDYEDFILQIDPQFSVYRGMTGKG